MPFKRKNCDDVLSRHEFVPAMSFYEKYPDCVSGTYEEHNIDILRKNRVFTRFFAPFWHFDPVTKNHETQIFSGFWWGANACRRRFDPTDQEN